MTLPPDDPVMSALVDIMRLLESQRRAHEEFRQVVLDQLADILELIRALGPKP